MASTAGMGLEEVEFVDTQVTSSSSIASILNDLDVSGFSQLHWAVRRGDIERVAQLLSAGADIERVDADGLSPLEWAMSRNQGAVARLLIENGARIHNCDLSNLMSRAEFLELRHAALAQRLDEFQTEASSSLVAASSGARLELSFFYFTTLPERVFQLVDKFSVNLSTLCLSFNNLTSFPSSNLARLSTLRHLELNDNLLTEVPESLQELSSRLQTLDVSRNFLSSVSHIVKLESLTSLNLARNQLTEVPQALGYLASLVTLNLSHNFLSSLPRSIGELATLESLDISHNYIASLDDVNIARLPSITYLDLSYNRLSTLPFDRLMLSSTLKTFRYHHNAISQELQLVLQSYYTQPLTLDLSNLALSSLPKEILLLTRLESLSLRNNRFTLLPSEIGSLTTLTSLDLSFNKLTDLPLFLRRLTRLKNLELEETKNYLNSPPKSVVDRGLRTIFGHFDDLLSGEPCYRMKLMLVGQENVGKSTLLHSLMQHKLKRKSKRGNISTDGIDIEKWAFKANNKTAITFSAWDFAGQEIYYTTHSFFISTKAIYIVVWDLRYADDHSRVEFWLNSVASRASNAPVILVGTHLDDPQFENNMELVQQRLEALDNNFGSRFTNIKGITAVSATSGNMVTELADMIKDIAMEMPNMKDLLPKIYVSLEDTIQSKISSFTPPAIQWDEFCTLASEAQFQDEEQLLRAIHFLNDLGSLVFFEDEKTHERLIILNPQWLTGMFASVITTKHKMVKNGLLYHKHLGQIWRAPQYPESLHRQLIALLQQFEIMFELPEIENKPATAEELLSADNDQEGGGKCYLLPSLLPEERPAIDLLWTKYDANELEYQRKYELDFVPHGLFSRLMIRLLHFTDRPLKYWRNGVLAVRATDKALVTIEGKIITAATRGDGGAELLRVIIEIVDSLVNSWFHVKLTAVTIPCPHCISNQVNDDQVHYFSIEECEAAAAAGTTRFLSCPVGTVQVRLDRLVPDIAMTDFEGSKVNFNEIEIGRQLGKGSFGVIYLGKFRGETVAVKRLKVEEDMALAAFAEFRREVWLMSGLSHPCIVNLKGYSTNPLTMVMECVPGGDLYGFLHNASINVDWHIRLKIAIDIALGMAFLHGISPPLLHRDLKSPNVLIMGHADGSPVIAKVADFGLSSRLFVDQLHGRPVENPTWCAPEILQKNPYTEKADVYSYGVMLWEILTRKLPFDSYTFQHQVEDDVIRGIRPDIPEDCPPVYAKLIRDCWDANPRTRPAFNTVVDVLVGMVRSDIGEDNFRFPIFPVARLLDRQRREQTTENVKVMGALRKRLPQLTAPIHSMAFVLNQVWCGLRDGTVTVVSAESGDEIKSFSRAHSAAVTHVAEIGGKIWCGSTDGKITVWKPDEIGHDEGVVKLKEGVLSRQTGEKKLFRSWKAQWYSLFKQGYIEIYKGAGSAELVGQIDLKDATVEISAKKSLRFTIKSGDKPVTLQAKSEADAREWIEEIRVAIASVSGRVLELVSEMQLSGPIGYLHNMGEGNVLVGGAGGSLTLLDQSMLVAKSVTLSTKDLVRAVIETNSHLWVAVGSSITRVDPTTLAEVDSFSAHSGSITSMVLVGNQVWSASEDCSIVLWDVKGAKQVAKIVHNPTAPCAVLALKKVGNSIWSGGADKSIVIWDTTKHEQITRQEAHQDCVSCLEIVFDTLVWSGSFDSSLCVWN